MFYLTMHSTHFILWLYGIGRTVKDHSDSEKGNLLPLHELTILRAIFPFCPKYSLCVWWRKEGNVLFNNALNTFYLQSDIWLRTILIVRKETRCHHIGYSIRLAARVLLYAPSHRQDCTYHDLCYTSRGALAGTRNRSMGPPHEGSIRRPVAPWGNALTTEIHLAPCVW